MKVAKVETMTEEAKNQSKVANKRIDKAKVSTQTTNKETKEA